MEKNLENLKKIGSRLKEVRLSFKMTLREISAATEVSLGGISGMESGNFPPSFPYLVALAEKFSININWILTGKGVMKQPDIELNLDFGRDNHLIEELIYCLFNDDLGRVKIMHDFLTFRKENPDIIVKIQELLKKKGSLSENK